MTGMRGLTCRPETRTKHVSSLTSNSVSYDPVNEDVTGNNGTDIERDK
jgi:hypothetical protein